MTENTPSNTHPQIILLPLREKVSAEPTDEGCFRKTFQAVTGAEDALTFQLGVDTPHPTRRAGHLLPQGEKGIYAA